MSVAIASEPVRDWNALGREWTALEAEAPDAPVFRCWSWVGCLAEERFPDPVLVRASAGGRLVGLALFNRRGARLLLGESGEAERDSPFVEHNGPLLAAGAPPNAAAEMLRAACRLRGGGRLVLGGVEPALEAAAGGVAWRRQTRPAPFVDLDAARRAALGGGWLAALSANTRQQLRRSDRALEAHGPLRAARAEGNGEALRFFAELVELHTRRWGGQGAYATEWQRRFHEELVLRTLAAGQLDLLRVTAGEGLVGLLHNMRRGGAVLAYQSGWREWPEEPRAKPGLSCHHQAIKLSLARGDREYDFLAGGQRYKRNLATAERRLVWLERVPRFSARGLAATAWGRIRGSAGAHTPKL